MINIEERMNEFGIVNGEKHPDTAEEIREFIRELVKDVRNEEIDNALNVITSTWGTREQVDKLRERRKKINDEW